MLSARPWQLRSLLIAGVGFRFGAQKATFFGHHPRIGFVRKNFWSGVLHLGMFFLLHTPTDESFKQKIPKPRRLRSTLDSLKLEPVDPEALKKHQAPQPKF